MDALGLLPSGVDLSLEVYLKPSVSLRCNELLLKHLIGVDAIRKTAKNKDVPVDKNFMIECFL